MKNLLAVLIFPVVLFAQTKTGTVSVQGNCNGTATGEGVTVIVKCANGISEAQANKLAGEYSKILVQVRKSNLSLDEVIERLKSLQQGVETIRSSVAGRHLSPLQIQALNAVTLSPTFDKSRLAINNYSDPEATSFAREFLKALGVPDFSITMMGSTSPDVGIVLSVSDDDFNANRIPQVCNALIDVFRSQNIVFKGQHSRMTKNGQCALLIGLKPPV